jgi:hypothetical protein
MYQEKEDPRNSEREVSTIGSEFPTNNDSQNVDRQNAQLSNEQTNKDAMTARTPERWWLRKRLVQG